MKKLLTLLLGATVSFSSFADEGMWLPLLIKRLNQQDMEKMGLQLTAEEIYSVNHSSLKDAIVSLGGFCTAEVISKEGLLLTNHHCAFDAIQSHSSVENNYLSNGFWAASYEDELPNEGLYARFLVRMADVTERVLKNVTDTMPEGERQQITGTVMEEIVAEATEGTHYEAEVKSFFEGNEYYLFVYETYRDVRLVGAPPSSIGKFGGDSDNWMWPRQTGDFALLRVYMGPDGQPAEYSPENIPLKPRYHLPVSLQGVQENDFAMIMGYPGSTNRYMTSFGVNLALTQTNPARVKIRDRRLNIMKNAMDADEDIRIKYASKHASVSNYWKYFIGQSEGLKNLSVVAQKKEIEDAFMNWTRSDAQREEVYGHVLSTIEEAYDGIEAVNLSYIYLSEAVFGTEILPFSYKFMKLKNALAGGADNDEIASLTSSLKEEAVDYFKDYHAPTDQKIFAALLEMYYNDVDASQHPEVFDIVQDKYSGSFTLWADSLYNASIFDDREAVLAYLEAPDLETLENDPAFGAMQSFMNNYYHTISPELQAQRAKIESASRLFIRGLRIMNPDKKYYPDANSTLRLTYGQVLAYEPRDGVIYKYYTTLQGVMEKEDPENEEFIVPEKLKELYNRKDYGQYGKDSVMYVGFITNNDITGGNSGSPVINGNGELIGIAFDGNWEAMSGDIAFEPELQRCISVDIRYVLFLIDKFAGASRLIDEMNLVKGTDRKRKKTNRALLEKNRG